MTETLEVENREAEAPNLPRDKEIVARSYEEAIAQNAGARGEEDERMTDAAEGQMDHIYHSENGEDSQLRPEDNIEALSMVATARAHELQQEGGDNAQERQAAENMFNETYKKVYGEIGQPAVNSETFNNIVGVYERFSTSLSEVNAVSIEKTSDDEMKNNPRAVLARAKELQKHLPGRLDSVVFDQLYSKESGADELSEGALEQRRQEIAGVLRAIYELEQFIKGLEDKIKEDEARERQEWLAEMAAVQGIEDKKEYDYILNNPPFVDR
jgi:hypothetical protein